MYGAVTFTSVPGCLKDQSHALGKEGVVSQFGGYFSFPSVCPSLLTIRPLGQGVPFIYLFIYVLSFVLVFSQQQESACGRTV